MNDIQSLYFIIGPTAVGKTALALDWAERNEAEIINGDSLCFYRGMDIGTAKPTPQERARIPHHCVDFSPVNQACTVADYIPLAEEAVRDIISRGKRVLVVGGSGFYLKSYFSAVIDTVELDDTSRVRAEELFQAKGLDGLLSELARYNPQGFGVLDIKNPRRVMAALRRCWESGKSLQELMLEFSQLPEPYAGFRKRVLLLQRSDQELRERIALRTTTMLEQGLIGEVEGLLQQGIAENPSAAGSIGYRETIQFLQGGQRDVARLIEQINLNTWKLVRKQKAFFRHQIPISYEKLADAVNDRELFAADLNR
jgi:tRNA dimethylallyltransferase